MKQNTIEKFTGLAVQPNSLTLSPGQLERAENAVVNYDYIISKCRGENLFAQFVNTQSVNRIWDYGASIFAISQNTLYRVIASTVQATLQCFNTSLNVSVRRNAHGIRNNDYISQLALPGSDALAQAFTHGTADIYGTHQVQTDFAASVTTSGATTTITSSEHGMINGNTITIGSNSRGITAGTYAISAATTNTFQISTSSTSTGALTYTAVDSFRITALNAATADATSTTNAASYYYYTPVTSPTISVTGSGVGVSRQFAAQGNSYFTTDNGVYKLEREDLPALEAGLPPGLDVQVSLSGVDGPIKGGSQTGYRVVFGRKDAQGNLNLSAPSQQAIAYNPTRNGFTATITISGTTATAVVADIGHPFTATGQFVTVLSFQNSSGNTSITSNSTFPLTSVIVGTSFTFTYDVPTGSTGGTSIITYGYSPTATITASIPAEIDSTQYLFQVYRTSGSVSPTAEPEDNYRLVAEQNLTAGQIANGFLTYTDDLPQLLLEGQPYLYTNSAQEGILQANARPPRAEDVTIFKGYAFYANTKQYHLLSFTVIDPSQITATKYVQISDGVVTERYLFVGDGSNDAIGNESTTTTASVVSTTATITISNHGFLANDVIRITDSGTSGIPTGNYTVQTAVAGSFTITIPSGATGTITFEGLTRGTNRLVKRVITAGTTTVSQAIFYTASYLVKAINRNLSSIVYGQYTSEVTAPPGSISLLAKNLQQAAFSITAETTTVGAAFEPVFPTSGTAVQSEADIGPNRLYIGKLNEPEAVPIFNTRDVGSRASPILRVAALRDSMIILKGDGIYRLNGDSTSNFTVTVLDNTVLCKATDSVVVLNNSVYCLSNQGVVQITDSSVQIVSRIIEPLLTAILGSNLEDTTSAVGYESERLYLLSVKRPNTTSSVADVTYCYNYLTQSWTSWTGTNKVFFNALIKSSDDKLYSIPALAQNKIVRERKDQSLIDYTAQEHCVPVIKAVIGSTATSSGSNVVTYTSLVPHGLINGQVITVSRPSSTLTAAFSGGAVDLIGLRTCTVISEFVVTFVASTNALSSANGDLFIASSISEAILVADAVISSSVITITTQVPHQLTTGWAVTVEKIDSTLAACFAAPDDVLGYRSVTVLSPTQFTFLASTAAIASSSVGTLVFTDKRQTNTLVTIDTVTNFAPSAGDAIVAENKIYKIESIFKYNSTSYVTTLQNSYKPTSTALAFVNQAYRTLIKFAPLTFGQAGILKQYSEFQATFRNFQSCTAVALDFASDSVTSSSKQQWNYKVGTDGTAPSFGGWGELEWGNFPWGGEASIQRVYTTQPAVVLRTYVPREVFIGTFIQPIIDHKVAGEPLELQAISLFSKPVTQRVSR